MYLNSFLLSTMCSGKGSRNSLCDCHCGTRVDINPQLLEEREVWKAKCEQLELQYKEDLKNLKEKIYKECSTLMEHQLRAKQQVLREQQKKRTTEYQSLHERLLPMQPKIDELSRENQFLHNQIRSLNDDLIDTEGRIQKERRHNSNDIKQLMDRHALDMEEFQREREQAFDRERKELEAQIYHLRHQIADFESKYRQILPELEKLRHTLHSKNTQTEQLRVRLGEEVSRSRNDPLAQTTNRRTPTQRRADQILQFEYRALQRQIQDKNKQIQKLKSVKELVKTEIKYQTVYVDRPFQVQRIVQRVVQVQRVVKQYVQPKQPVVVNEIICDDNREDYQQLVTQINNRTRYIAELQNQLAFRMSQIEEYQSASEQYQKNIQKYKSQRQNLAQTIGNKNKEIEALQSKIQAYFSQQQSNSNNGQKIVVNVKKDGTYSSTVEKAPVRGSGVPKKK